MTLRSAGSVDIYFCSHCVGGSIWRNGYIAVLHTTSCCNNAGACLCVCVCVCVSSFIVSVAAEQAPRPKFEGVLCFT